MVMKEKKIGFVGLCDENLAFVKEVILSDANVSVLVGDDEFASGRARAMLGGKSHRNYFLTSNINAFISSLGQGKTIFFSGCDADLRAKVLDLLTPLDIAIDASDCCYDKTNEIFEKSKCATCCASLLKSADYSPKTLCISCDDILWSRLRRLFSEVMRGQSKTQTVRGRLGSGNAAKFAANMLRALEAAMAELIAELFDVLSRANALDLDEISDIFLSMSVLYESPMLRRAAESLSAFGDLRGIFDKSNDAALKDIVCKSILFGEPSNIYSATAYSLSMTSVSNKENLCRNLYGHDFIDMFPGQSPRSLSKAFTAALALLYAQTFSIAGRISLERGLFIDLYEFASLIWNSSFCSTAILPSALAALKCDQISNVLFSRSMAAVVNAGELDLRGISANAIACAFPMPAFTAAMLYLDSLKRKIPHIVGCQPARKSSRGAQMAVYAIPLF